MDALTTYMVRRADILPCLGTTAVPSSKGKKWYGMTRNEIDDFIACEACYEDLIADTAFSSRFISFRGQGQDDEWSCDLGHPYISRALTKLSKLDDWHGFLVAASQRLKAPECKGTEQQTESQTRYMPCRGEMKNLAVCEACYLDKLALTRFEPEFKRWLPSSQGWTSFVSRLIETWTCKLTATSVPLNVALAAAVDRRDNDVFWQAAEIICKVPPCTVNGIVGGTWWTLNGGCPNFDVCTACYVGILWPNGLDAFFETVQHHPKTPVICDLSPGTHRFAQYVEMLDKAMSQGVFSHFSDSVKKFAAVPACPGIETRPKATWWGYSELTICHDCYLSFVADTPLGKSLPINNLYEEDEVLCQMWSPRMRALWLELCDGGSPGSPESEAALAQLKEFASQRLEIYVATVGAINLIKTKQQIAKDKAHQYSILSIKYQGMEGMTMAVGGWDGRKHRDGVTGEWYNTDSGVMAQEMSRKFRQCLSDSNRPADWTQMSELEELWKKVE